MTTNPEKLAMPAAPAQTQ